MTLHDPSEPLEDYLKDKLNTLCRALGTLLRTQSQLVTDTDSKSRAKRRKLPHWNVAIVPLKPSDWNSVEFQNGTLDRDQMSEKTWKRKHAGAFHIMHKEKKWDGNRSYLRGYWQNEDGTLVEIHPDFLGDPEPSLLPSSICIPDDTRLNQATREGSHREKPRFAVEEGRPLHAQLCSSTSDTVPTVGDRIDEEGDGIRTYEEHSHLDVSWGDDGGQGSNQPRNAEETLDSLGRGVDKGYVGSYYETPEWSTYYAMGGEDSGDHDVMNLETE